MKTRMMVLLMVLVGVALLAACATSGKLDPNTVRTDSEFVGRSRLVRADAGGAGIVANPGLG